MPSGISSEISIIFVSVPLFPAKIIYVISSFSCNFPNIGHAIFDLVICGFITWFITSFVSSPSTFAVFFIVAPYSFLAKLFTVTLNLNVLLSPGFNVIFSHTTPFSPVLLPPAVIISFSVVPSGASSSIFIVFASVPSFPAVILYVIVSPSCKLFVSTGLFSFSLVICGFTTLFVTSFVSSSSTFAVFFIVLPYSFSGKLFTITLNSNVLLSPGFNVTFSHTTPFSPILLPPAVIISFSVVPSGASSSIFIVFASVPSFPAVILYVIVSPSCKLFVSTGLFSFSLVICGFTTSFITSFVLSPSTIAIFFIVLL